MHFRRSSTDNCQSRDDDDDDDDNDNVEFGFNDTSTHEGHLRHHSRKPLAKQCSGSDHGRVKEGFKIDA